MGRVLDDHSQLASIDTTQRFALLLWKCQAMKGSKGNDYQPDPVV